MLLPLFLLGLALGAVSPSDEVPDLMTAPTEFELKQKSCPAFWYSFQGSCYKYVATMMTWADAELFCVGENANLVSIHSLEEDNFVKYLIKNFDVAEQRNWIGFSDIHKEARWMWSDGSKVSFVMWGPGQPSNGNYREHCAHTNYHPPKTWNDVMCSETYAFVCKSRAC